MKIDVQETIPAAGRNLLAVALIVDASMRIMPAFAFGGWDLALAAAAVQLIGGWMLVVGWHARGAALWLAFLLAAGGACMLAGGAGGDESLHALKQLALAGGLLQVAAFGAGGWSLDDARAE